MGNLPTEPDCLEPCPGGWAGAVRTRPEMPEEGRRELDASPRVDKCLEERREDSEDLGSKVGEALRRGIPSGLQGGPTSGE